MQNLILYKKLLDTLALKCCAEPIFKLFEINMLIPTLRLECHHSVYQNVPFLSYGTILSYIT